MKRKVFISAALIGVMVAGCSKDDDTEPATTTTTGGGTTHTHITVLTGEVTVDADGTEVSMYSYNTSGQLTKIGYGDGTTVDYMDSLTYNTDGTVASHVSYDAAGTTAYTTHTFNYSSTGELETVLEVGEKDSVMIERLHSFSYNADGKLSGVTQVYLVGGDPSADRGNDTLSNFVYDGNNLASINYSGMEISATSETTAPNPYYGLFIDPTEFIDMINENNILSVYATADPTQVIFTNTYTYADGRVATITSVETDMNDGSTSTSTTTLTFEEFEL